MAPEQAMGEKQVDARADVYALGVVTYEMLAGEPPFSGPNAQAIVARVLSERPRALDMIRDTVPPQVAATVETALAKLPADRFQAVRGFAEALAASEGGRLRPSAPAGRVSRWRSVGVPALMLALGVALGALAVRPSGPARVAGSVRPVRLTYSGQVACAAISPDGREYAAITGVYSDETGCVGALVVRAMPAGADQVLADSLTSGGAVRWSPNGSSLLLQASIGGRAGLRVVSRTGAGIRLLRAGEHGVYGFADDRTVFVVDGVLIRLLDAESGDQRDSLALSSGALPSWLAVHPTRQGWAMAYQAEDRHGIYLVNGAGVVTDSIERQSKGIAWLGGDRLVAVEQGYLGVADIVIYGVSGGGARFSGERDLVWAGLPAVDGLSATVSGDKVMLVRIGVTDEQQLFDLRGPAPRATHVTRSLNAYLGDPAFSPDGRLLAYAREDALGFNTYVRPAAGGPERAVTSDSAGRLAVTWTGERRLVNWAAGGAITVLDIETGRARSAGVVPAGRVFRGGWENRLFWVDRDSDALIETDSLGREVRAVKLPAGTRVVMGGAGSGEPLAFSHDDSTWRVHRLLAGGSGWHSSPPIRSTASAAAAIGQGRDGSFYFTRFTGGTEILRLATLASTALERVATLPVHCYLASVRISPDGAWAVCNVTSYDPDVWVLPLGAGQ
jgi:serine/threonine-protein kinase